MWKTYIDCEYIFTFTFLTKIRYFCNWCCKCVFKMTETLANRDVGLCGWGSVGTPTHFRNRTTFNEVALFQCCFKPVKSHLFYHTFHVFKRSEQFSLNFSRQIVWSRGFRRDRRVGRRMAWRGVILVPTSIVRSSGSILWDRGWAMMDPPFAPMKIRVVENP